MLTLSGIWLQVQSVAFHPLDRQEGRARVQLELFLFANQLPVGHWPPIGNGAQELLYGQALAPQGGLFNEIVPYGEFGVISFRLVARDLNNAASVECVDMQDTHGATHTVCFPFPPMSLSFSAALPHQSPPLIVNGQLPDSDVRGRGSAMVGEKFTEDFTVSFFVWADPPIVFGGATGSARLGRAA